MYAVKIILQDGTKWEPYNGHERIVADRAYERALDRLPPGAKIILWLLLPDEGKKLKEYTKPIEPAKFEPITSDSWKKGLAAARERRATAPERIRAQLMTSKL